MPRRYDDRYDDPAIHGSDLAISRDRESVLVRPRK